MSCNDEENCCLEHVEEPPGVECKGSKGQINFMDQETNIKGTSGYRHAVMPCLCCVWEMGVQEKAEWLYMLWQSHARAHPLASTFQSLCFFSFTIYMSYPQCQKKQRQSLQSGEDHNAGRGLGTGWGQRWYEWVLACVSREFSFLLFVNCSNSGGVIATPQCRFHRGFCLKLIFQIALKSTSIGRLPWK